MGSLDHLRAWWASRQGLSPATRPGTLDACIRLTGWLPTSGAPTAYLSIRARMPGVSRVAVDQLAMDGVHVIEVPGLAGRPYLLVPPREIPFALRLHGADYLKHVATRFARGEITEGALRAIGAQVCAALEECPLSTSEIRQAVTHRDAGAWLGVALHELALRGIIRRFPSDGRIDSTKYQFELRHPDDRPDLAAEGDDAAVEAKAIRYFLSHFGPATVDEIVAWCDLTKGAIKRALAAVRAERVTIAGWNAETWLLSTDRASLTAFKPERDDRIAFLPYRDPYIQMRLRPALLTRAADAVVLDSTYGTLSAKKIAGVDGLNHHAILRGPELVGVWEYDPKARAVVIRLFETNARLRRRVDEAADDLAALIRDQIGDAKLSAVDPPEKRAKRLAFCRAAGRH